MHHIHYLITYGTIHVVLYVHVGTCVFTHSHVLLCVDPAGIVKPKFNKSSQGAAQLMSCNHMHACARYIGNDF